MALYSHTTKDLLEIELENRTFSDSTILNSDIDNLACSKSEWNTIEIKDSNCNDSVFDEINFIDCELDHSSFINTQFRNCKLSKTHFNCTSLIKLQLINSVLKNHVIDSCTLHRSVINKCIIQNSTFKDFEGISSKIDQSVFINCNFEITYGSGMNGYSSGLFENCIFINCSFTGFPLRGAETKDCAFINCTGEISDSIQTSCTYGLENSIKNETIKLSNKALAEKLISEVS